MKFTYTATTKEGKTITGEMDATAAAEVLVFLAGKGLKPVSIQKTGAEAGFGSTKIFAQTISITDQVFLTKYLSLMLRVGVDLFKVIDILTSDFDKPALKTFLMEVKSTLEKGQPFYSAFAKHTEFFSPVFINLVKAGEISGNLDSVLENLSVSLEREQGLRSRIRAALIYPIILLSLAVVILLFLVTFALPKIAGVFSNSGFNPPLFSKVVFAVGLFIADHIVPMMGGLVIAAVFGWYFLRRTQAGKAFLLRLAAHVPVLRTVFLKISLQRFAGTLSALMKSGMPILESLRVTSEVITHPEMKIALLRIADEGVSRGLSMGESFRKERVFPLTISNLIAISEKAGHSTEILQTLSTFYETEVDSSLKTLVAFIEPVMLLGIGGIVGLIALSIIIPIYQLVGQF